MKIDVFIASNEKEFADEITYILDSFKNNSIFNKYFNVYINDKYLSHKVISQRVEKADIYIGLIGNQYGFDYIDDISATEFEYNKFTGTVVFGSENAF